MTLGNVHSRHDIWHKYKQKYLFVARIVEKSYSEGMLKYNEQSTTE